MILVLFLIVIVALVACTILIVKSDMMQDRAKWRQAVKLSRIINILVVADFILAWILLFMCGALLW